MPSQFKLLRNVRGRGQMRQSPWRTSSGCTTVRPAKRELERMFERSERHIENKTDAASAFTARPTAKDCSAFQVAVPVTTTSTFYTTVTAKVTISASSKRVKRLAAAPEKAAVEGSYLVARAAAVIPAYASSCNNAAYASACSCIGITASTVVAATVVTSTRTTTRTLLPTPSGNFYLKVTDSGLGDDLYVDNSNYYSGGLGYGSGISVANTFVINKTTGFAQQVSPDPTGPLRYRLNCYEYDAGISYYSGLVPGSTDRYYVASLACNFDEDSQLQCTCHDFGNNSDYPCYFALCNFDDGHNYIYVQQNFGQGVYTICGGTTVGPVGLKGTARP